MKTTVKEGAVEQEKKSTLMLNNWQKRMTVIRV